MSSTGATTYSYDPNGNRTSKAEGGVTTTYGYDAENRLTSVGGPTSASYRYDGDGYRVKKTIGDATPPPTPGTGWAMAGWEPSSTTGPVSTSTGRRACSSR